MKQNGPAPWIQHKWLEGNAETIVRYARRHGTYAAQERFAIKDYTTLNTLLVKFKNIPIPEDNPETVVDDLLSSFTRFLYARQKAIEAVSKQAFCPQGGDT